MKRRLPTVRPQTHEYGSAYRDYVDFVPETDVLSVLDAQLESIGRLRTLVPEQKEMFAYAPGKWTIRELVGHLGDAETVFGFRAFAFGRADQTPLPSFDEDAYVANSQSRLEPLGALIDDFVLLRQMNLRRFRGLPGELWSNAGTANGTSVTVRALAFILAGHVRHHFGVLRERYGVDVRS